MSPSVLETAFAMPGFLVPWADRFFEPPELELVRVLADGPLATAHIRGVLPDVTVEGLERSVRRGILDREPGGRGEERFTLADFHARFDVWAMFEGWKDLSPDVAEQLTRWELEDYARHIAGDLEALRQGRARQGSEADYAYVLLPEAEDIVARTRRVYLFPCNCRSMFRRCRKSVNVCLRFENDRGLGWEISSERAVAVLRETDRSGLMHTAHVGPLETRRGICNCCTDCCFPHLAADHLGTSDIWPRRRYSAAVSSELCTLCGRCSRRCPFGALTLCDADAPAANAWMVAVSAAPSGGRGGLAFAANACRGCGLCATGCPEGAISMRLRPEGR